MSWRGAPGPFFLRCFIFVPRRMAGGPGRPSLQASLPRRSGHSPSRGAERFPSAPWRANKQLLQAPGPGTEAAHGVHWRESWVPGSPVPFVSLNNALTRSTTRHCNYCPFFFFVMLSTDISCCLFSRDSRSKIEAQAYEKMADSQSKTGAVGMGSGCKQRWSEKPQGEAVTWASNGCTEILGCGTGWKGHSATRKGQVIFHCT